ncbi:hypothetical protein AWH56_013945 [Anaerobacillus isosaccharinicus]|uniref:Uncharacterized protein n=1 Tax=Anaerobacillus isosaccharinicus TaxID=1532552 RepID=A0A1S2LUS0_9BACI|nr:hypothetical protein [Anaerobacillus isosaccharinicus]MBA5588001.1 hypothetical protein [Anaerobacillus isosaccharinicus]QOY33853.1 hypothetical protein AWH56_013945 [Anaerobacillus isosaccharinicus]
MSKKWNFTELNQINWNERRKQSVHQKVIMDIDKLESKRERKHVVAYLTSCALFLIVIFAAYQFFMSEAQNPAVGDDEKIDIVDENKETINDREKEIQINDDYKNLRYYGTISSSEDYYKIAMTDVNAMYFIPVNSPATVEIVQNVNFESHLNSDYRIQFGLQTARSDIPLQSYEIKDNHLHLYFNKNNLMNLRGSTGSSMGIFSIHTFAENFKDQVTHYTAYGDGEPFIHEGEGFDIVNVPIETDLKYLPIRTHSGVFLQQQYNYQQHTIEEVLGQFFALHKLAITDEEIDFSMFSLKNIEESSGTTVLRLTGDLNDAFEKNEIEIGSLKKLIVHGVGANVREQLDHDQAKIYLNDQLLFDGNLNHIKINDLNDHIFSLSENSLRAKLITTASAVFTHLENEAWELLMRFVHPDKGLLFSTYAFVDQEQDVTFTKEEVAAFASNENTYLFGQHYAKDGFVYEFTPKEFIDSLLMNYEQNMEKKKVPYEIVTFNQVYQPSGGIINNIGEAYPEGRYVEFFAPAPSEEQEYLWQALRFVFEEGENRQWYLVAIVRDVHSP